MNDVTPGTEAPGQASPSKVEGYPRPRLWPAMVIVAAQWLGIITPVWVAPLSMVQFYGMFFGPIVASALFVLWWLFGSRVRWRDRFACLAVAAVCGLVLWRLADASLWPIAAIFYFPAAINTAWALALAVTWRRNWPVRRMGVICVLLTVCGLLLLVRFEGTDGELVPSFAWRWSRTTEELFLAERATANEVKAALPEAPPLLETPGDWPGFRGATRDGRRTGVRIGTGWQQHPPRPLWRQRVGPGWSSFAVIGSHVYTQEQRGAEEVVVCYDADSGSELWVHKDHVRFSDPMGGPGPRATPTFHEGRIYTLGASGLLNCLDAATGGLQWSHDVIQDSGAELPVRGFASSPLVWQGIVTVLAGATDGMVLLGYQAQSGALAWHTDKAERHHSYSSVQPARLAGVEQLLVLTAKGLAGYHPTRGALLWRYDWPIEGIENGARMIQPVIVGDADVLLGSFFDMGTRRLRLHCTGDQWTIEEVWTCKYFRPYFNDLVVCRDCAYGFDGCSLACLDLANGMIRWKERRYGTGQVLLLADQGLLLVLSEWGKVALVEARPDKFHETASFQAIEGKTWNHPVVAHGKLFVRNSEEMACYPLALESGGPAAE